MVEAEAAFTPARNSSYRGHIAELNAIRAIAVAIVLLDHFWPKTLSTAVYSVGQMAWIAMDAFFVLSGFLITGILVDTKSRPDYFRNYYVRRALRIFPLYYVVLLASIMMLKLTPGGAGYREFVHNWGSPGWFAVYLGNIREAYLGAWPPTSTMGVLWSLQIEEQFYLFFPFLVRWMRLEHLSRLLWCMVFLSPVCRIAFYFWNPHNTIPQYVLLPCHMEGLALGSLIAIRFRTGPWEIPKIRLAAMTIALMLAACVASVLSTPPAPDQTPLSPFICLAGYSLSSFACAGIVLLLILFRGSRGTRPFRTAPIAYIAKISYGIYLLHSLVSRLLRWTGRFGAHLPADSFARFVAVVSVTFLVASISWYAFESPLLRLKDRLAPSHQPDDTPVTT